jgi:conjugal transfer pilus assembly protein TraF
MKVNNPILSGMLFCALSLLAWSAASAQSGPWWNQSIWSNPDRGTVWYPPDRTPETEEAEAKAPEPAQAPKPPEIEEFERVQKRLEELRKISIISPTEQNLRAYIEAQEQHMQRASVFADQWQRTLWANPELKYAGRPTNATGITGFDANYSTQVRSSLAKLAPTHGLYFFFRSDCPFCHSMAPTLKQLEQIHGIRVVAISLDGGPIPHFPNAITDKGQAQALGVRSVPSFYLASPQQKTVYPLGTGVLSLSTIEDRIFTQAFTQPGSKF